MRTRWLLLGLLWLGTATAATNIRRVDLEGFQRVPLAGIRRQLPVQPGQPYDAAETQRAKDWLLGLGLFLNAEVSAKTEGQVVDLLFKVVENPDVRAVRIEGNTQIASAALRPSLLTQPRQILNRRYLALDANSIGKAYLDNGMRIVVDISFDPAPEQSDQPVVVVFKITEATVGAVRIEPLEYLRRPALEPLVTLRGGELIEEKRLVEQRLRLAQSGLFKLVENPATSDPDDQGRMNILFRVAEQDLPLLTAANLPLVDLAKLARFVRFSAVEVPIEAPDFELYLTPDELAQRRAAAEQAVAARPNDAAALYDRWLWTRRGGLAAVTAAQAALAAWPAAGTPQQQLQRGLLCDYLGQQEPALTALQAAAASPASAVAAYEALLTLHTSRLQRGVEAVDALRQTLVDGLAAVAKLPDDADLAALTAACRFYYTALTVSMLGFDVNVTDSLRIDAPACRRLVATVARLFDAKGNPAAARHLGRLLTAVGFAAQVAGPKVAPEAAWKSYLEILGEAREILLPKGIAETSDPAAWFFLALADVLRDDAPAARATVLDGLKALPANERLADVYVLTCVQARYAANDNGKSLILLQESIRDVQARLAGGTLPGWGPLLLLAKLNLALRDALPDDRTAEREQARQAADAAASAASSAAPQVAGNWWILGLCQLKGPQPASALSSYQKVAALQPNYREVQYALGLTQLLSGDQAGGLATLAKLRR
ncbi:MAG: hypothetical protein IT204_19915 [Fimbriimonadaceae bacterium]|nr:hypothetical protein [Fimbriimonadaceae bacterium]